MKKEFLTILFVTVIGIINLPLKAQTDTLYYLNSSFETPEDQSNWTSLPSHATIKWKYEEGGHSWPLKPYPPTGSYNAIFYWSDFGTSYYRTLVSDPIDLSSSEKPQFTFWHAQAAYIGQDELYLLFKAGPAAQWDTIAYYPNEVADWSKRVFNIQDIGSKYLCDGFQIGFLGMANGGQGVCIDSVVIKETATIDKFVHSYEYDNVEHYLVASKTKQLPMIRVRIELLGNNGDGILNNISFRLNSGNESYFKASGFKLFHTISDVFKSKENSASTQIGSAVSISGGTVNFTGLNHKMELGNNYLWLTADLANDIPHLSNFSFGVDAHSFQVNDTLLPANAKNNIFTANVYEAVFYDNFDASSGWTLQSDFEIAVPQGKVIGKSKDPAYAYSGSKVLGTDLTADGAYPYPLAAAYHAISPMINLRYYDQAKVYMRKWNDFNPLDRASIAFSTDGGTNWTTVWMSHIDNPIASTEWDEILFSTVADEILSKNDSVRIRFSVLESNTVNTRAGFNIDNFTIAANHLDTDVGITRIISPYDDCLGFHNDTVRIVLKNYAEQATPAEIPVYFGLWGLEGTLVHETVTGPIAKVDSLVFTFATLANFPQGDIYDKFIVGIDLAGDEDSRNDTITKSLHIPDSYITPALSDFEYKGGIWLPSEGSTWLCKAPEGSIPLIPGSPKSWILSPYGDYRNNDTSWVISNCFDLTWANRQIVELDYWLSSEAGKDGAALQYSTDDGETWHLLDYSALGSAWGWYTSGVAALGHNGWSGDSDGWETVREFLPESLNTEIKVKFRIIWAADGTNNARGMAFDNFKVYPAPPDVGVSTIEIPEDACQYEYPNELSLWVKNYGYNDLEANDTMIIGYDFESELAVIDTFLLAADLTVGDSMLFTLPTSFDASAAGTYQIRVYTLIEDDPFFYVTNNDTAVKVFEVWPVPITNLPDTMSSRQPDTLMIEPHFDPDYSYLWGDMSTSPTYDVSVPGNYYLTVTEINHGCQTFDSVYIQLLFADVGIDSIIWPQSSCELGNAENVQIQIRNIGTDSLIVDDKILLFYEFNGGEPVSDSITLTETLLSGRSLWFTFEGRTEDLSSIGDYSIKTYTDYGGDTVSTNDTLSRTIFVYGYPSLNLGSDTIINGLTYNLQADPGFTTYLWENGETTSNRLIDTSGYFWLDVWDEHGCPASDSIDIWFRIRDVSPQALISPVSSCDREGTEVVTVRIVNSGSDTLYASDNIDISYNLDGGARTNQTINISQLLPGQTYDYTYAPTHDLSALGTYTFSLTANTPGDMRENNDTLDVNVYTSTDPVVDLGVTEDVYYVPELVLDAGYGENYAYLWQDGSTDQTFTVTDITTVEVLVTDMLTGCYGGDTALVYLDIKDYMITTIDVDEEACSGTYENMAVTLINNGNLPREGTSITLDYSQNGNFLFTEQFENIGNWPAGASRIHTTRNSIDMNTLGAGNLEIEITSAGDLRPENDLFTLDYEVMQSPLVDFGGSQLEVDFPYILDAGSGYPSYLWSTGATSSSITAMNPGSYSVTVTADNGCITHKSVYIDTVLSLSPGAEYAMNLSIYPNPARDFLVIEASFENPGDYILEIFSAQNSLFISREIYTADYHEEFYVGDLPPGIYFIRFRNSEFYQVRKIIVQ